MTTPAVLCIRERYGVTYGVDLMAHPAFGAYSTEERLRLLQTHPRRVGTAIFSGGCAAWTEEQFLDNIRGQMNLARSWEAVLAEDNFITRALGIYG